MYQNYIFDLYGTLIDIRTNENKPYLWKKLALWYSLHGAPSTSAALKTRYQILCSNLETEAEKKRKFSEISIEQVFYLMFAEHAVANAKELALTTAQMFRTMSIEHLELMPGALMVLENLKKEGKKLYLLSNAQRVFTEPELQMCSLKTYFNGIFYSSDAGVKKPSEEFYDIPFAKYGLNKKESVMIGNDFDCDVLGATRYGIDSIYFFTGEFSKSFGSLPDNCKCIQKLSDILNYLN